MPSKYPGGIEDPDRFRELVSLFEAQEQRNYYYEQALATVEQEFGPGWYHSDELILGGPMLLMYTWNFAARETKSLDADTVSSIFERHHQAIEEVRSTALVDADLQPGGPAYETVKNVWADMKDHFGQTGTSKVLSLLAPELFVMWDQDIRTRSQRRQGDPRDKKREDRGVYFYLKEAGYSPENNKPRFGRTAEDYILFLQYCKEILQEVVSHPVLQERDATPAKLLDESLYAFYKLENE
ncbi:hypothetical protein [Halosimplex sp. TS25]|uniref:hypothetical protein n=1 Tax=Halosimplex rarum TaxID=3396619 RepID=UPI0039ED78FC